MAIYTRTLSKIDIDFRKLRRINEDMVTNAYLYQYRDMIIKRYWALTEYSICEQVFDVLCKIDSDNFIKLYELFTIISDEEYEQIYKLYLSGKRYFTKDGYTAKYYEGCSLNPILESSNYLIDNIERIRELVNTFSNAHIMMQDTGFKNVIIQEKNIVIIDPDYYRISNAKISKIREHNYKEILILIRTIFEYYSNNRSNVDRYFDKLQECDSKDALDEIEKSLKRVREPIDIIK